MHRGRHAGECEFAGAVWREMRNRDLAADRRNIDNATVLPVAHSREHGLHCVVWSPKMDLHRVLEILLRLLLQRADLDHTGIVDQNIDRTECRTYLGERGVESGLVRNVADLRMYCRTEALEF